MEAGEFGTVRDLAIAVGLAERHVSRQLRLAYLAPEVLKRLVYGREGPAVTVLDLSDCAALPWAEQAGVVFEGALRPCNSVCTELNTGSRTKRTLISVRHPRSTRR